MITQNPRISLSYNDHRSWYLHIKNVQEADRGWYMCQVNTDPMRSRQGYLQVVGKLILQIDYPFMLPLFSDVNIFFKYHLAELNFMLVKNDCINLIISFETTKMLNCEIGLQLFAFPLIYIKKTECNIHK